MKRPQIMRLFSSPDIPASSSDTPRYAWMRRPFRAAAFVLLLTAGYLPSSAQEAGALLISLHGDLIKSDNDGFFEKGQGSAELNYHVHRKFTATAGAEWWTGPNSLSLVLGARWCPVDEAYIRARALPGEQDFSLGGGWTKPLPRRFRIEAMADVYFSGHLAIRAGLGYRLR